MLLWRICKLNCSMIMRTWMRISAAIAMCNLPSVRFARARTFKFGQHSMHVSPSHIFVSQKTLFSCARAQRNQLLNFLSYYMPCYYFCDQPRAREHYALCTTTIFDLFSIHVCHSCKRQYLNCVILHSCVLPMQARNKDKSNLWIKMLEIKIPSKQFAFPD